MGTSVTANIVPINGYVLQVSICTTLHRVENITNDFCSPVMLGMI